VRIFVTGASGYIGSAVAGALSRAGHQVFGLVRTAEKARAAEAREIAPVLGALQDTAAWSGAAASCQVCIHCAFDSSAGWNADRMAIETVLDRAHESGQPRLFLYTSGVWIYGDTGGAAADEASDLHPLPFSLPRLEHERFAMSGASDLVRVVVLRPGCVYGGRGGLTASWFENGAIVGDGHNRWAMVHVEDLADAYVRAAESSCEEEIFNITDRSRFTVRECAEAALRAAQHGGPIQATPVEEAVRTMGAWAAALAFDQHIDSSYAARRLGWQPRHGGFVDGVERYHAAWKASRAESPGQ